MSTNGRRGAGGELKSEGLDAIFVRTDVSQECAVKALFETTLSHYGRVDVLYNNAAVLLPGRDLPDPRNQPRNLGLRHEHQSSRGIPLRETRRGLDARTTAEDRSFSWARPLAWWDAPPR